MISTPATTLVQHFLEVQAQRLPDKTALVYEGTRLTYSQIDQMANRLANALISAGLQRGDRVVIHLPNSVAAVIGIFAVLKAGGVFVVLSHTTKQGKLLHILQNCRAVGLLCETRSLAVAETLFPESHLKMVILCPDGETSAPPSAESQPLLDFNAIMRDCSPNRPSNQNIDLDLACLIYTSGSTGDPKGVMSDHSNMVFAACSIIQYLENVEDDIIINVLPLSFDYGLYQLLMAFKIGGTLVLERGFTFPAAILQQMAQEKVTGFPGVPTIFSILLRMDLSPYDLSQLRYISNTAAALPPTHINQLRSKFPGVTIYSMYGLTETKRTLYLPPAVLDTHPGSVGIAIPGTEVWIEDEYGHRLSPGEIGELVVRGRHVMRGYWEDEKATAERYRPGPIHGERLCYTGDLFRMDQDGYFYFVARKDDIIKSRGEKVAPKEVENVLLSLPGVLEAAVIGKPDAVLGEAVCAIIVTDGRALAQKDILLHCQKHLEDFMVPRQIEFRAELPKTSSGKIQRSAL